MRKIFQHKNVVKILAFLVLILALISFSMPKIQDYNLQVEDEQKELRIKSDGASDRVIRFSKGWGRESSPVHYAEIVIFLSLFFSLLLTKRIIFSFLFAFLFAFQLIVFLRLFYASVEFPDSYFLNYQSFSLMFIACVSALSVWQARIISQFYQRIFQPKQNFE